jgi:hypothetical protein
MDMKQPLILDFSHRGLGPVDQRVGVGHWAWSLPPVAIATSLSVAITSLHFTSQRMGPLFDLAAGKIYPSRLSVYGPPICVF